MTRPRYKRHVFCKLLRKEGLGEVHIHSILPPVRPFDRLPARQILYYSLHGDWFEFPKDGHEVSSLLAEDSDAMMVARLLDRELA